MNVGALGAALAATSVLLVHPAYAQEECPSGKPHTLVRGIIPVIGEGPVWAAVGDKAIAWTSPDDGLAVLWIRDYEVSGAVLVSGAHRTSGAKAGFGETTSALGTRNERHRLGGIGFKPDKISDADLKRYSFHRGAIFFPEPGCYEITARVGGEEAKLYLNLEKQ